MELPGTYREDAFKEEYENALVREQIQLLDRNINAYKDKLSSFETKLRVTEQENTEIKSSFWYKLFGKK